MLLATAIACASSEEQTKDAVNKNAGRGTLDNSIPAGEWMDFKDGKVRATRMIRPASTQIKRMNMYNADPQLGQITYWSGSSFSVKRTDAILRSILISS